MQHRRRLLVAALPALALAPARALEAPVGAVVLQLAGRGIGKPNRDGRAEFDMAMLERLSQRTITTVTPWYPNERAFSGPLLRDVLDAAQVSGERARLVALNDYRVEVPLADARQYDVIVARLLDGKPMGVREKGPLFVMYPFDQRPDLRNITYYSRCVWQLKAIEVL